VFQPLVMRVTDGSLAVNPVMGVTVTFETTLARVSPDPIGPPGGEAVVGRTGQPVLLGSSEALVVSNQDGLAAIVPSVGSVGPCDVFISVSAGPSSAQFQMESVAAATVEQPQVPRGKNDDPTAPRVPRFGGQMPAPQGAPDVLFAVPQGALLDEQAPSPGSCSGVRRDSASSADLGFDLNGNSGIGEAVPRSCEPVPELPNVDHEAPQAPAESSTKPPAELTKREHSGGDAGPAETARPRNSSAMSSSAGDLAVDRLLDSRSCRFAQNEDWPFSH
jgi:hypothetical protein